MKCALSWGRELLKQKVTSSNQQPQPQQQPQQQPPPKASPSAQALTWHIEWHSYSNTAISKHFISQPRHFFCSVFWWGDTKRSWNPRHNISVSKGADTDRPPDEWAVEFSTRPPFSLIRWPQTLSKHSWLVLTQTLAPKTHRHNRKSLCKMKFFPKFTTNEESNGGKVAELGWSQHQVKRNYGPSLDDKHRFPLFGAWHRWSWTRKFVLSKRGV